MWSHVIVTCNGAASITAPALRSAWHSLVFMDGSPLRKGSSTCWRNVQVWKIFLMLVCLLCNSPNVRGTSVSSCLVIIVPVVAVSLLRRVETRHSVNDTVLFRIFSGESYHSDPNTRTLSCIIWSSTMFHRRIPDLLLPRRTAAVAAVSSASIRKPVR